MKMTLGFKPIAAPAAPATWDPTVDPENPTGMTLSNGNLTATKDVIDGNARARSSQIAVPNKIQFELTVDNLESTQTFALADAGNDATFSYDTSGFGYYYVDPTETEFPGQPAIAEGNIVSFYWDRVVGTVWVAIDGVLTAGDPVAGTGGYPAPIVADPTLFLFINFGGLGTVTANFGPTLTHPKTGFTVWNG
jgi:hypothetical protein